MRVSQISLGMTKNLGNFQSLRVDVQVSLEEAESFDDALVLAQAVLDDALGEPLGAEQRAMLKEERRRFSVERELRQGGNK